MVVDDIELKSETALSDSSRQPNYNFSRDRERTRHLLGHHDMRWNDEMVRLLSVSLDLPGKSLQVCSYIIQRPVLIDSKSGTDNGQNGQAIPPTARRAEAVQVFRD